MKTKTIPLLGSVIILILFFYSCSDSPTSTSDSKTFKNAGLFRLVMTDKPIYDIQNIYVTVSEIKVHKPSPTNWIVVSKEEQEFDLLELKKYPLPIAETELEVGFYNQIRLSVISGRIIVSEDEGEVENEMKITSSNIKIPVHFEVEQDGLVQIILDFDAEESIKVTKKGKKESYNLHPVIKVVGVNNS